MERCGGIEPAFAGLEDRHSCQTASTANGVTPPNRTVSFAASARRAHQLRQGHETGCGGESRTHCRGLMRPAGSHPPRIERKSENENDGRPSGFLGALESAPRNLGPEVSTEMERRSGVEPESSDWQTEILTVELPPRIGGPTESRTQRADLARISCTPVPSPKKIDKGEGMAIPSLDLTA
jgi:hypothetical protein